MASSDGGPTRPPLPFGERPSEAVTAAVTPPPGLGAFPSSLSLGPLAPGEAFGPRYHIIKLLGAGGMGAVYQAWDHELGIAVALKVIRPEAIADLHAAEEMARRFKRELLLARQVTHKNVVRIHDLGEISGIKYITMSYVEGEDLTAVLRREGKLELRRALKIARQILAGLAAAHEAGVVHRDLKPANIMIDADDNAVIMDFGIARSDTPLVQAPLGTPTPAAALRTPPGHPRAAAALGTPPASIPSVSSLDDQETLWTPPAQGAVMATLAGAVMGTVGYMAPEQALAKPVDHRADLYTFGLILTEMLVGRVWRSADLTPEEQLFARIEKGLPPIRSYAPEIPPPVDELIARCLQIDPDARFASTRELVEALDRLDDDGQVIPLPKSRANKALLAIAAALLVTVVTGGIWLAVQPAPPPPQRDPVSILVADFENRTGDPSFEGSLEQALKTAVEQASYIRVFPQQQARTLALQAKPDGAGRVDPAVGQLIARREGIQVLLAGMIERQAAGFRVGVQAIDPANGRTIIEASDDVSAKNELVASLSSLAARLRVALGESETEMTRLAAGETFTTTSLDAMQAYARGQEHINAGRYQEALKSFEAAVKHDPQFGRAYALIGTVYINLKEQDRAEAYFQEAMKRLDRMTEREKYRTLGGYYLGVARNYDKAIETFETLIKLFPADDIGYNNLALAYLYKRDLQRAKEVAGQAIRISNSLMAHTNYSAYAMYAADFKTAVSEANLVLKQNPTYEFAYLPLALSTLAGGDAPAARETYDTLAKLGATGAALASMGLADLEIYLGRYRQAVDLLRSAIQADERAGQQGELARKYVALAEAYEALGRRLDAERAALKAASLSSHESVLFPAARVLIHVGKIDQARKLATELENKLQDQTISYARLVTGEIALVQKRLPEALDALRDAQKRHDSWFAHFLLGRAYLEAPGHEAEAFEEFDRCLKRRGETTDVFFNDAPTLRYLPALYYWAARAQEKVGAQAGARGNYEQFLQLRAEVPSSDPLVTDARARLGAQ